MVNLKLYVCYSSLINMKEEEQTLRFHQLEKHSPTVIHQNESYQVNCLRGRLSNARVPLIKPYKGMCKHVIALVVLSACCNNYHGTIEECKVGERPQALTQVNLRIELETSFLLTNGVVQRLPAPVFLDL